MRGGGYALDGGGYIVPVMSHEAAAQQPGERRRFPLSQAELAFFYPSLADHLTLLAAYHCQEGASPLVDVVGGKNLTQNQALLYARPGDPLGRAAVEFDTGDANEFASNADTAFWDLPSNAGRTLICRFRCPDTGGAAKGIAGTSSVNTGARWGLRLTAAGKLVALASDGTTTINPITVADADDNVFHDGFCIWDRLAEPPAMRVGMDGELVSNNLTTLSAADVPTGLRIGSMHALVPVVGLQSSYIAYLAGAMTQADMAVWGTPV